MTSKETPEHDYGFHANGKPRRVPIRLLSAGESLIYWFLFFVPIIWIGGHYWQPMVESTVNLNGKDVVIQTTKDAGLWFNQRLALTFVGWLPFGLIGNVVIRLANKFILRTDWARPSALRSRGLVGAKKASKVSKGYVPPKEYS